MGKKQEELDRLRNDLSELEGNGADDVSIENVKQAISEAEALPDDEDEDGETDSARAAGTGQGEDTGAGSDTLAGGESTQTFPAHDTISGDHSVPQGSQSIPGIDGTSDVPSGDSSGSTIVGASTLEIPGDRQILNEGDTISGGAPGNDDEADKLRQELTDGNTVPELRELAEKEGVVLEDADGKPLTLKADIVDAIVKKRLGQTDPA